MTQKAIPQILNTNFPARVIWEKLPDDFVLPDDPVDNINQPTLAAALTDSLENAGKLADNTLTTTNYGICAKINDKFKDAIGLVLLIYIWVYGRESGKIGWDIG
jgi:hypothetical protein